MGSSQAPRPFQPRRSHKKSRLGCQYCKYRKVKCDETHPSCSRCVVTNRLCVYLNTAHGSARFLDESSCAGWKTADETSRDHCIGSSPSQISLHSEGHILSGHHISTSNIPSSPLDETKDGFTLGQMSDGLDEDTKAVYNDLYLFDAYLDHADTKLGRVSTTFYPQRVGMPLLAAEHMGLLCSFMALGAAGLAIDLLVSQKPSCDYESIDRLVRTGDQYHQKGLKSMGQRMALQSASFLEVNHAQSAILFVYALARRRISRLWDRSGQKFNEHEICKDRPDHLEWLVYLRGISATGLVGGGVESVKFKPSSSRAETTHPLIVSYIQQAIVSRNEPHMEIRIASKHPMFSIVSGTRKAALEALEGRVERFGGTVRLHHRREMTKLTYATASTQFSRSSTIAACALAVDMLVATADSIFEYEVDEEESEGEELNHITMFPDYFGAIKPWLREYLASRPLYHPDRAATRLILSWACRVPAAFAKVLLPPVEFQAISSPGDQGDTDVDHGIRVLAWDIFAHWLALVVLIEDESWWLADLGIADISHLRVTLGKSSMLEGSETWWPWSICSISQQLKRYSSKTFGPRSSP